MSREPLVIRSPYRAPWTRRRKLWSGIAAGVGANAAWTLLLLALALLGQDEFDIFYWYAGGLALTLLIGTTLVCLPGKRRFGIGVLVGACISPVVLIPLELAAVFHYIT